MVESTLAESAPGAQAIDAAQIDDAPPSVLHLLNVCNRRLERLLDNLRNELDAEAALRAIAADVVHAVDQQPDIALAAIFLNQIAGSYPVRHCIETAVVAIIVARRLGKSDADIVAITAAALTMNVGMLRHQDTFQNKQTPLSSEEMSIVHRHPEDSATLLQCAGVRDDEWISCVLLHHENDDGSGYPAGVARPEVTLNAKLLSLADRYCAQVSARNYRRSIFPAQAIRNLRADRDNPADAALLDVLHRELGDYPPGCLVRLAGGEVAVVRTRPAHHTDGHDSCLQIVGLRDAAGAVLAADARPLMDAGTIIAAITEDDADTRFSMKQVWGPQAGL